jgi:hypothetical protein
MIGGASYRIPAGGTTFYLAMVDPSAADAGGRPATIENVLAPLRHSPSWRNGMRRIAPKTGKRAARSFCSVAVHRGVAIEVAAEPCSGHRDRAPEPKK